MQDAAEKHLPVLLELKGHLTSASLRQALLQVDPAIDSSPVQRCLLVDSVQMSGYDGAAREAFITWARQRSKVLRGVAIVTDRTLWRMVITAMGLASSVPMRPFESRDEAMDWLSVQ